MIRESVEEELLRQLHQARRQRDYKGALALALAKIVGPPRSGFGYFYANALSLTKQDLGGWEPQPHEVVADLTFMHRTRRGDAWSLVAAAESEAWPKHRTALDPECDDEKDVGYFWDFWKLLQCAAPMRLMLAVTTPTEADELLGELRKYADRYAAERIFARNDRLFVAVVRNHDAGGWLRLDCATHNGQFLLWEGGEWVGDNV